MNETTDASATFAVIWRRKWLILAIGLLVAVGSYVHYKKAPTKFTVKTQLYLGATAENSALLNSTLGKQTLNSTALANQAALINSTIGEGVHKKFRKEGNGDAAKTKVKAKATASSDFIVLTAEGHTPAGTAAAANAYAQAYIARHQRIYTRAVQRAINTTKAQIARIEAATAAAANSKKGKGGNSSASTLQTAALQTKLNNLESALTLGGVQQIGIARPAKAELVGPKPKKNAIFGFVIGVVLATLAVYVASRFNRRLRSMADIEVVFKLPILAAVPTARNPIIRRDGQVRTSNLLSEPLRRLHTTLRLEGQGNGAAPAQGGPRTILFLSPDPGDGKSTLAAGLALTQRDANERSLLIEADFRRPVQARILGLEPTGLQSLSAVLSGSALPSGAMVRVSSAGPPPAAGATQADGGVATMVSSGGGSVSVLLGGNNVTNPPALLARPEMAELLHSLRADFDHILVDAPPPLQVSDVMPLLNEVDGIVIVARIDHTRDSSARRLMDLLERTPSAEVLGVVANAVKRRDSEHYGFTTGLTNGRSRFKLPGR
jgi:succinoglycan biosynthesis transport protein ExoP